MNRIGRGTILFASSLFLCCTAAGAASGGPGKAQPESAEVDSAISLERDLAYLVAPIKSKSDLLRIMSSPDPNPLDALSHTALARFISSLEFSDRGLTSFSHLDLEAELSASQIYKILALFGQQHLTPLLQNAAVRTELDREILEMPSAGQGHANDEWSRLQADHLGYQCEKRATCSSSAGYICTSNC